MFSMAPCSFQRIRHEMQNLSSELPGWTLGTHEKYKTREHLACMHARVFVKDSACRVA